MGTIFSNSQIRTHGLLHVRDGLGDAVLDEEVLRYCYSCTTGLNSEVRTVLGSPAWWGPIPWPWCPSKLWNGFS